MLQLKVHVFNRMPIFLSKFKQKLAEQIRQKASNSVVPFTCMVLEHFFFFFFFFFQLWLLITVLVFLRVKVKRSNKKKSKLYVSQLPWPLSRSISVNKRYNYLDDQKI